MKVKCALANICLIHFLSKNSLKQGMLYCHFFKNLFWKFQENQVGLKLNGHISCWSMLMI
jgi:hypothetical protein